MGDTFEKKIITGLSSYLKLYEFLNDGKSLLFQINLTNYEYIFSLTEKKKRKKAL